MSSKSLEDIMDDSSLKIRMEQNGLLKMVCYTPMFASSVLRYNVEGELEFEFYCYFHTPDLSQQEKCFWFCSVALKTTLC